MKGEKPTPLKEFKDILPPPQETKFESTQAHSTHLTTKVNYLNSMAPEWGWKFSTAADEQSERQLVALGYEVVPEETAKQLGVTLINGERLLKIPYGQYRANKDKAMADAKARSAPIAGRKVADDAALEQTISTELIKISSPEPAK